MRREREKHFCRRAEQQVHKIQIKRQKVEYARPMLILILGLTRWKLSECEKKMFRYSPRIDIGLDDLRPTLCLTVPSTFVVRDQSSGRGTGI
jgi:hypothetical protein